MWIIRRREQCVNVLGFVYVARTILLHVNEKKNLHPKWHDTVAESGLCRCFPNNGEHCERYTAAADILERQRLPNGSTNETIDNHWILLWPQVGTSKFSGSIIDNSVALNFSSHFSNGKVQLNLEKYLFLLFCEFLKRVRLYLRRSCTIAITYFVGRRTLFVQRNGSNLMPALVKSIHRYWMQQPICEPFSRMALWM